MPAPQAQTAECLVVGEIATQRLLVVLNKVDLLPGAERPKLLARARRRLSQTLAATKFAACPMVAVAAKPGARPGALCLDYRQVVPDLVSCVDDRAFGHAHGTTAIRGLQQSVRLS